MSMSLDGFVAGPDQSREDPLGKRGRELHGWRRIDEHHPGVQGGTHGRHGVLGGSVPEGELCRAESDAFDVLSGDQHLPPPGPRWSMRPDWSMLSLRDVNSRSGGPGRARRISRGLGVS
jgi:hypothetical protein